jgi:pyruvate formate lyase activating enzyme
MMDDRKTAVGRIFKLQKYALHDGPGIRTTVFFKGCPLNCRWCHNPEGIAPEVKAGALQGDRLGGWQATVQQVLDEIEKDRIFYDQSGGGVTFSGGEPTLQPEFLGELLAGCRQRAIHTALDTCGWAPGPIFARIADQADLVLFDLKLIDPKAHRTYTGSDNRLILDNFRVLAATGRSLRVRVPLVPGITDTEDNLRVLADFLNSCGAEAPVDLLPFHAIADQKYQRLGKPNPMAGVISPSPQAVGRVCDFLNRQGFTTTIGG